MSKTITIVALAALVLGSNIALADSFEVPSAYAPSLHQVIVKAADYYAAPASELLVVAQCESGMNENAIGKAGEIGLFQYFPATWDLMTRKMGVKLDIHSASDQAELTAWVFASHPEWKDQWSTYRNWYMEGKHRCKA